MTTMPPILSASDAAARKQRNLERSRRFYYKNGQGAAYKRKMRLAAKQAKELAAAVADSAAAEAAEAASAAAEAASAASAAAPAPQEGSPAAPAAPEHMGSEDTEPASEEEPAAEKVASTSI